MASKVFSLFCFGSSRSVSFIIDFERQEFLNGRDDVPEIFIQPEDPLFQLLPDDRAPAPLL